jgi:hypothetical protein
MAYGSNLECSLTASILLGVLSGGLTFAWHAVPYGLLMKRIGRSWKTGALLSVLPLIGSVSAVVAQCVRKHQALRSMAFSQLQQCLL